MNLQRPFQVVAPTLDGDVLTLLARADRPLTGRAIARESGGSHGGVQRALEHLVAEGIVTRERAGRAFLYRLNRDHLAARWIEGLASLRLELIERLRQTVATWQAPADAVVLFGSAARNEAGQQSDIDLLVIRPTTVDYDDPVWRGQVRTLESAAATWTGNDTRVLEYATDELANEEPVLDIAAAEGIELHGSLRRLLRTARRRRA
jgi:predicted transcriptional regulator